MLFNFDFPLFLKELYSWAGEASMDPGAASSDVLYLHDEHRFAKIDASWVID